MKDLIVNVSRTTRMVDLPKNFISVDGENLQSNLIFKFTDEFVNGQARLEYHLGSDTNYITLNKNDEEYSIPLQNVITKEGKIKMQLVITEGTIDEDIPVFKSNVFTLYCNESINAVEEAPSGYDLWIEQANTKLNEVDNLDLDITKENDKTYITITKKDGSQETEELSDGITPTIGQNGNWYLGETDTGRPSRGKKGLKGDTGERGVPGQSNTLVIGTVEKGENAGATITGESPNQVLNLVLPKGDTGEQGPAGQDGPQYFAGDNITIDENNVISASGGTSGLGFKGIVNVRTTYFDFRGKDTGIYFTSNNYNGQNGLFKYVNTGGNVNVYAGSSCNILIITTRIDELIGEVTSDTNFAYGYGFSTDGSLQINSFYYRANGYIGENSYSVPAIKINSELEQTFTGEKVFNSIPKCSSAPTDNSHLVNKKYVDDTIGDINTILATLTTPNGGGN